MSTVTCTRCGGDGIYHNPSSLGPACFACKGTGQVRERKARPAKVIVLSPTIKIADRCGGRPMRNAELRTLDYLGLTAEQMSELADLWDAGIREINRGSY